jgi:hypothetical protein
MTDRTLEVHLPFPSSIVQTVFFTMQQLHETGKFPHMRFADFSPLLDCVLYLQFHSFLTFSTRMIWENFTLFSPSIISQFPLSFRRHLSLSIPISYFDPDFMFSTLGFDILSFRFSRPTLPILHDSPFETFTEKETRNPFHSVAISLLHFDHRFATFSFVRTHCTQFSTKSFVNLSSFLNLHELSIAQIDLEGIGLRSMLPNCLRRLSISKTKLQIEHIREVIEFMEIGKVFSVSLCETKLGPKGCELITAFLSKNEIGDLRYLDVSSNGIGAVAIEKLLKAAAQTVLSGIGIDANFFEPSAPSLSCFPKTNHSAISLKGLHWDQPSAQLISQALKNPSVTYWDLGAQVVHQHSDPDLSFEMAEAMFQGCASNIECLLFANHQLDKFSLNCLSHVNLKALSLANSKIEEDTLTTIIPLLNHLIWIDLSSNSIVFRTNVFLSAAAASPSLHTLILSHNEIGDMNADHLFNEMCRNQSRISILRVRNCFLKKHAGMALLNLLVSGVCSFDELDLGGNEMFHSAIADFEISNRTRVENLYIGGNGSKTAALCQLFNAISGLKLLDFDRTVFSVVFACRGCVEGILGISICFSRISNENELIQLLQQTEAHELWVVHSISQKILDNVMERFREIPLCLGIHVGDDIEIRGVPTIPVIVETEIKFT